jgi:hypothetical protein
VSVEATKKTTGGVTGKGFQPGKSGNPGGRKKGAIDAATRIQQRADWLSKQKHPKAEELSVKFGFKVETMLDVYLLELGRDNPRSFLEFLQGGRLTERHEITGADGAPLKLYSIVSPDDL